MKNVFLVFLIPVAFLFSCSGSEKPSNTNEVDVVEEPQTDNSETTTIKKPTAVEQPKKKLGKYYQSLVDDAGLTLEQVEALKKIHSEFKAKANELKNSGNWAGKKNLDNRKQWESEREQASIALLGDELYGKVAAIPKK